MLLHQVAAANPLAMLCRTAIGSTALRRKTLPSPRMPGVPVHRPQAIVYAQYQYYAAQPISRVPSSLLQRSIHTSLTPHPTPPPSAGCSSCSVGATGTTSETGHSQGSAPSPATNDASNVQPPHLPPARSLAFWLDPPSWRRSAVNTLHCLLGCSIGDLSALFIFANYFPHVSMVVVMPVAMASGIVSSTVLETLRLQYALPALGWRGAVRTALNMSFLSMLTMEAAENATNVFLARSMGGGADATAVHAASADTVASLATMLMMDTQHPYFLLSLALSTLAGFLAPLPYNYYVVRRYNRRCH